MKHVSSSLKGGSIIDQWYNQLNDTTTIFESSKIFAGLMVLILNITSKYVEFKLSPSVESFLKNSFGVEFLIFIILWVGTKNLLVSIILTGIFILIFNFLLNEESQFCILPEAFTQYYNNLDGNNDIERGQSKITQKDVQNAIKKLKGVDINGNENKYSYL
jgi:uncharacterized membrane protein